MPTETRKVLERLANRSDVFVAIISGRSVANVKQMVGIEGKITYIIMFVTQLLFPYYT